MGQSINRNESFGVMRREYHFYRIDGKNDVEFMRRYL